jgi:hypothetical protein
VEPSGKERRKLRRTMSQIPVQFESEGVRGQGQIKNLHKEGLFVRSHLLPRPGSRVSLRFESARGKKLEIEGSVRWTTAQMPDAADAQPGFGVLLDRIDESYLRFYEKVLLG